MRKLTFDLAILHISLNRVWKLLVMRNVYSKISFASKSINVCYNYWWSAALIWNKRHLAVKVNTVFWSDTGDTGQNLASEEKQKWVQWRKKDFERMSINFLKSYFSQRLDSALALI